MRDDSIQELNAAGCGTGTSRRGTHGTHRDSDDLLRIMRTTDSPAITAHARCDFCSKRPVVRLFPCASFPVPGAPAMSEGGWAACEGCAALVEAEAFDSLLLRGALSASLLTGADVEMAKEMLRPIYETFFRLRKVVPHV